jgi:hypothetical protein
MATILYFTKTVRATQADACASRGASAELILFPGVRYERQQPEAPAKSRRRGGRATHDVIDLPD